VGLVCFFELVESLGDSGRGFRAHQFIEGFIICLGDIEMLQSQIIYILTETF